MEKFYSTLFARQQAAHDMPSNVRIWEWARDVFRLMFPERNSKKLLTVEAVKATFTILENELYDLLLNSKDCIGCDHRGIVQRFFENLPQIYHLMLEDAQAMLDGDPAANNLSEVIRTYPGFLAICMYRMAHQLWLDRVPLFPRILTEYAHERTGIDIHPGATIGRHFHIDHGTGLVIGETAVIGDHVKLYQGVTLGALSVDKVLAGQRRHPIIEDHVIIYAGATILGGNTRIGHHSVIGGNVWITSSVPPDTTVFHKPQIQFIHSKVDR
ncbi:serine O-acetyltransferase EpsC [Sphingobacterium sp. BIGb0165]|jgi:Serine acetyltransferase|uniref:serine O-acetyltransferase EpsC n=1 Tax=Sphingobacterium sp. BIGb0165 TaxID=2940615 RepID=UPI002166DABA|nr:serine O-acetyltransferase EpsC [Sphingobacterium sp. BIGb0165]MCS4226955.1 serine O-acetyltransferase [Sphingobacterium sp. BIGb0165]